MKKLAITLGVALATMLAANGFAQTTRGEADPAGAKAMPAKAATAEEKADAKKARKAEGASAMKAAQVGNTEDRPAAKVKVSASEKKAAAIKRKAAAADARKAGEPQKGEATK